MISRITYQIQTVIPFMPLTTPLLRSELLTSKAYDKIVEKSSATVPARFVIVVNTAYMTPSLLLGQTMTLYIIQTVRIRVLIAQELPTLTIIVSGIELIPTKKYCIAVMRQAKVKLLIPIA